MSDLMHLFNKQEISRRWKAEMENATARYELALINERCAYLISQHDPVFILDIDRSVLRIVLDYLHHGNLERLYREHKEIKIKENKI